MHRFPALLLLSLCLPLAAGAQLTANGPPTAKVPPIHGIAHVAIRVSDLAASRAFYEKLGYEEAFNLSKDGAVYESFMKINDRQFIELYPVRGNDTVVGFLHLCFDGDDLEAIHKDYTDRGLTPKMEVRKAGAGNFLFTMDGPAQPMGPQNIEYTQYLPGSLHTNQLGKHLGTHRIADRLEGVTLAMQDPAAAREFYATGLRFPQDQANPAVFHLPGDSGEQVEIAGPEQGLKARITLATGAPEAAEKRLAEQKVAFTQAHGALSVTDPDGNLLRIEARRP